MTNSVILFDIDRTLIDTPELMSRIKVAVAGALNVDENQVEFAFQSYTKTLASPYDFDPKELIKTLPVVSQSAKNAKNDVLRAFFAQESYASSLYPDVIPTLTALSKNNTLGIFSQGVKEYQNVKLQLSGITHFFSPSHQYIFRRKCEQSSLEHVPKDAHIIDNSLEILRTLAADNYTKLIWLDRGLVSGDRDAHGEIDNIRVIHTLEELLHMKPFA